MFLGVFSHHRWSHRRPWLGRLGNLNLSVACVTVLGIWTQSRISRLVWVRGVFTELLWSLSQEVSAEATG